MRIIPYVILTVIALSAIGGIISWLIYSPRKERPKQQKRRILCIGDSITFGTGVLFTRWKNSFPSLLENLLGAKFQVLNYGISGATLMNEGDKPYSKTFFHAARKTNPEICILMLGTNDSKPHNWDAVRYEETLTKWILEFRTFPSNPTVYLMTPPAAFCVDGKPIAYTIRDDIIREEIRSIVVQQARVHNTGLIDLYAVTESHPELYMDGVHPNKQGNQRIAQMIYEVLKKNLIL